MAQEETITLASDLRPFMGRFSYDPSTLKARIIAVYRNYDENDPKTWPLVTAAAIASADGREYNGSRDLPQNVAYDETIVHIWLKNNKAALSYTKGASSSDSFLGFLGYAIPQYRAPFSNVKLLMTPYFIHLYLFQKHADSAPPPLGTLSLST